METIIVNLARSTGVSLTTELLDKVKETLRRLQNKLPTGCLGKGENCRTVLALEISCRLTGTAFERKQLLKHILVGENEYQKALTTCKAVLDITWNFVNVTEVLAMQYSVELTDGISPILNKYQTVYVDKLPANVRAYVKLDAPLYVCAAFCMVAENKQIKFDKAALCKLSETTAAKLFKLVAEMKEIVGSDTDNLPSGSLKAVAPQIAPASRGQRLLQAHLNNTTATTAGAAGAADVASHGKMRPLYEVRQNALQDSNQARTAQMAADRARNSNTSSNGNSNTASNVDSGGINLKSGLKRSLSTMQHALVSAGDIENRTHKGISAYSCAASANVTAHLAAEAAAKEKREAYEAWRDSMKKAKLNR